MSRNDVSGAEDANAAPLLTYAEMSRYKIVRNPGGSMLFSSFLTLCTVRYR